MGIKMGLNGIDNAKISFDHVRVPRENLLNKDSEVMQLLFGIHSLLLIMQTILL